MILKIFWPVGSMLARRVGLSSSWGNRHVYYHNLQRSSSMKPLGQSKPIFIRNIYRKWEQEFSPLSTPIIKFLPPRRQLQARVVIEPAVRRTCVQLKRKAKTFCKEAKINVLFKRQRYSYKMTKTKVIKQTFIN